MDKLLIAGIVCVIAAIVGGGLKAFGIEMPILANRSRQFGLGVFGIILLVIVLVNTRQDATPANAETRTSIETSKSSVSQGMPKAARWVDQSPIAVAPVLLHCDCLDTDAQKAGTSQWERLSHGGHSYEKGTKIRFTNQCPTTIQLFTIRDTVRDSDRVPIVQPTAGRSYSLETLNTGDRVVFDPYSEGPASVGFLPMNCPPAFARPVPFNCVSDARLSPGLVPPGPPVICAAQGPQNSPCSCNGRQGINTYSDAQPNP
jgi:hypothetical protein